MQSEYVEVRKGAYYLRGSRVSLASIVYEYQDGAAAETIRRNFPTLSLEQIHGAPPSPIRTFSSGLRKRVSACRRS